MCAVYLLQAGTVFSAGKLDGTPPPQASVVTTSKGILQGIQTGGVYSYKGIPYAKAPVGDLRFAPPQDTEPWDEVRDCTEYGPIAIQYPNSYVVTKNPEQSEDCLTLNIWTPAAPDADERLPVYVFIHGGGFGFGSGNEIRYDGTNFAQNGVIMVTINYRLSTLGFFSSQETYNRYGTTGNWGLLDQIKALEWVRDNIASFGGDPGKVTIGGESAGSVSVSALIVSPRAEGLFRSAIMESGSVLGIPSLAASRGNLQTSIETSLLFAKIFGAADNADGLEQLRLVDADILNYLSPFALSQGPAPQAFFYTPIFDGGTLPKDPAAAIGEGNFNKVNLLVGFNHDESSLFIQDPVDNAYYKTIAARVIGKDWRVYVDHFPVDENNSALQRTRQLFGGTWFVADTKVFGDLVAAHGGKVFMYNYNYVAPGSPLEALGAYHSSELDYVFNSSALRGVKNKKMALEMFTRWVNFIKNADPNIGAPPPTATQWPRYDPEKAEVIIFDNEVTAGPLPDRETVDFIANILPHP
jgi:para-nitrobenzyl esterase